MKPRVKRIIFDSVILGIFILVLIMLFQIWQEAKAEGFVCLQSPLVYGASQLEKSNRVPVSCSCYSTEKQGAFRFNSEGIISRT